MDGLAERLERSRALFDLDHAEIGRAVDASPRTVSRWASGEAEPRPDARERLLEVTTVLERLSGVLNPAAARDWLLTPNPMLDHHKPIELLHDCEYRRVLAAVDAMAEGV